MKPLPLLIFSTILLASCTLATPGPTNSPALSPTPTLGHPGLTVTRAPDPQTAAQAFLKAWQSEDYASMYAMLTSITQDAISEADFEQRYRDAAIMMTLKTIDYQVTSSLVNPASAQVSYQVTFHTTLLNDITTDPMIMNLSLNDGTWQIQWDDGLIMPALKGPNLDEPNKLYLDYEVPARGNIYDRDGHAIVAQADSVALGVVPGEIDPDQEGTLLDELSILTGLDRNYIHDLYKYADPTWYIPVGETSADAYQAQVSVLSGLSGYRATPLKSRYYYEGGIAPQTIGYVQSIPAEDVETYEREGYRIDQKVGTSGLEYWGEPYLAGTNGATLYIKSFNGDVITRLAHTDPVPSQSIYTTIDRDLQIKLQKSLGDFRGAVVVMERDTGAILAMVSNPTFDPNLLDAANPNSVLRDQILSDPAQPIYDRADQGQYPLGSVFKIVTMSAALETGVFTAQSSYYCGYDFTELQGWVGHDWTLDHGVGPSGELTLPQGLMRSCNPWFWHIGYQLYQQGYTTAVSDMARAFGLGRKTGFELTNEAAGNIPDPADAGDAVQLAIGQGSTMVTPLQVADFVAAVGNGGTVYQPQIIDKIVSPDGEASQSFNPIITGTLPVSAENLKTVQDAMISVVNDRKGTAYFVMANMSIPVAGKTGTATTSYGDPDAWFAGYTMANNPNKPDIAIAVLLENAGEGSEMAAPIFRRAVSLYFSNDTNYGMIMPWEASPYVVASPTPEVTDTPTNEPAPTDTTAP